MAVSKVRKLELIAHGQCREKISAALRSLGSVHISDVQELLPESQNEPPSYLQSSLSEVRDKLSRIQYCIQFLDKYFSKPSFIQTLLRGKSVFTEQEVEECIAGFDLDGFHQDCMSLEKEIGENENQIEKKETLSADVAYWLPLDCPLEVVHDTRTMHVSLGMCEARALDPMTAELSEVSALSQIEIVDASRTPVSVVLVYPKSVEESVEPILRKYGWRMVRFLGLTGTPAQALDRLREQIRELEDRNRQLRERVSNEFLPSMEKLQLLHDHYSQELHTLKVQERFLYTSHTFLINGWIVAEKEQELRQRLGTVTQVVEVRCSDPAPDDRIPILLENRRIIKPFGLITELYGRPRYSEFDPTPFFAPYFVLFFGVCLGDAGYGAVLAIASYVALKKLHIYGGARRLLQILVAGGLSSALVGLLTGGVFGIKSGELPQVFKSFVIFNATEEVLSFLYIAFALGVIQVLFGISVKMAQKIREGDVPGAIMDEGLWLGFLICLIPLLFKYLFGGAVGETAASYALRGLLLFGAGLVLTQGRNVKIIVLRPVMGLFKLYDAMGYFSDVLSYARLMALGLATAYLAMTINDIAKLTMEIPYGIGYIFAALILVFGHAFNLIINCLGAFVHSLRLQYLEFFSKFFTGGGEPFKPFAEEREYTMIVSG